MRVVIFFLPLRFDLFHFVTCVNDGDDNDANANKGHNQITPNFSISKYELREGTQNIREDFQLLALSAVCARREIGFFDVRPKRQYISLLDVTFARSENVLISKTKLITHLGGNNSKFFSCVSCLTVCDFVVTNFCLNDLSLSLAICVRVALVVVKYLASVCISLCGCCLSEWAPEREKTVNFV